MVPQKRFVVASGRLALKISWLSPALHVLGECVAYVLRTQLTPGILLSIVSMPRPNYSVRGACAVKMQIQIPAPLSVRVPDLPNPVSAVPLVATTAFCSRTVLVHCDLYNHVSS
jgi:hypothetical protein